MSDNGYFDPFGGKNDRDPNQNRNQDQDRNQYQNPYQNGQSGQSGSFWGPDYFASNQGYANSNSGYGYGYGYGAPSVRVADPGRRYGITSMVLGIVSIFMMGYLGILLGVAAVIFGIVSRNAGKKMNGYALAGIICGAIGIVISVAWVVIITVYGDEILAYLENLEQTLGEASTGSALRMLFGK